MEPHVFAAVLAAAALHAGWNALLKLKLEPLLAMTLVATASGAFAIPAVAVLGWPAAAAWPWLLASVALHLAYFVGLAEAYRRADMSQVYPIARGGAPLLTALGSVLLLSEPLRPLQAVGIAGLGAGVTAMSVVGRRRGTAFDARAIGFAALTAVVVCGYTVVDGLGARAAGDPHRYSAALFAIEFVPLLVLALARRGRAGLAAMARFGAPGLAGGAMSLGSYWIAIWAMTVAPIPLVAALRESSVLFAAVIALAILKEPPQAGRLLVGAAILASLALIRLG